MTTRKAAGGRSLIGVAALSSALTIFAVFVVLGMLPSESIPIRDGAQAAAPEASATTSMTPATRPMLQIPDLGVQAPVSEIALVGSSLTPPSNPSTVGWWNRSALSGARTGQTVITGHTVHDGDGAMNNLVSAQVGQKIVVTRMRNGEPRRTNYEIADVRRYTREEVAQLATRLFGQDRGNGRLVLVTCTGWNGTEFTDNIIVLANRLG